MGNSLQNRLVYTRKQSTGTLLYLERKLASGPD